MASFLDSLTNVFTGAPAKDAAAKTQNYLSGVQSTGNAAIDQGVTNATGAVGAGTDAARTALGTGYTTARGDVGTGADAALSDLDKGFANAGGYYDAARAAYDPLKGLGAKYDGATTLALNSLGVNGQAGTDAARAAFTNTPGYEFNLDQGIDAISRRRIMGGMLDSGNADRDAQTFGAGLASNQYDTWMNNLLGFTNPELSATSGAATGIAGVNQNQAGAASELGVNRAGVDTGRAAMLSDLASKYGTNSAGLETNTGNTLANIYQGGAGQKVALGTGIAQPYANTYLWNLIGNGGQAAAKIAGKVAGGFADGGRPPVDAPSIVGERGPEMFIPDRPGTIVPNEILAREALRDRNAAAREYNDPVARFMRRFVGPSPAY